MGNKYGAHRTEVDNIVFDSAREATRYVELKAMSQGGAIEDLEIHPEYPFILNGHKIGKYIADFAYFDREKEESIVEDVKGVKTAVYKLKKKLMLALWSIDILET